MSKRPTGKPPEVPTTPRSSKKKPVLKRQKPFKRPENGSLSKNQQVVRAMQDLEHKDNEQKKKRTKNAIDNAKKPNRNSWGGGPSSFKF